MDDIYQAIIRIQLMYNIICVYNLAKEGHNDLSAHHDAVTRITVESADESSFAQVEQTENTHLRLLIK